MAVTSLIQTSTNKSTLTNKLGCFQPKLCDIDEDTTLLAPTSMKSIDQQLSLLTNSNKSKPKLNPNAATFIPSFVKTQSNTTTLKKYTKIEQFIPKHTPRAKLNIYIGKPETKKVIPYLNEPFPNTKPLYAYLDVTSAFQMHDKQMYIYQTIKEPMISFINFDLHKKDTNELLYGIIIPNDKNKIQKCNQNNNIQNAKWLWKLDTFLTANEIYKLYGIPKNDLPQSSREKHALEQHISLEKQEFIDSNVVSNIIWCANNVPQIDKVIKKSSKKKTIKLELKVKNWIKKCKDSWNDFPAIPILEYDDSVNSYCNYWIEWVKLVKVKTNKNESYIGLSFKKIEMRNKILWDLQSIYLDKSAIFNKYCMFGPGAFGCKYIECFKKFDVEISEIQWL